LKNTSQSSRNDCKVDSGLDNLINLCIPETYK
jgi:hypothetical protein